MSDIAKFMLGQIPDRLGRNIQTFLTYNHFWLEHDHKYIQVLFPIDQGTKFNRHAPLVTQADCEQFENNEALQLAHLNALDLMLDFWGLLRDGEAISIKTPVSPATHVWLKPHDHNQLRLTRVIRSLTLLGNRTIAANLYDCVVTAAQASQTVSEKSMNHWANALTAPKYTQETDTQ